MSPWREEALKRGYRSAVSVPLVYNNKIHGVFAFYSGEKNYFNPEELKLIKGVGYDISYAIQKIKDEEENREVHKKLELAEIKFKNLIENNSDVITLINSEGKVIYETPSVERVLGYKPDELTGTDPFQRIHPDDIDNIKKLYGEILLEPGKRIRSKARLKHRNGTWKWVEADVQNLLNDEAVKALVLNFRDISDRIEAEQRIRESEKLYRTLASNFPNGAVLLFDRELRFLIADGIYLRKLGDPAETFEGRTLREVYPAGISDLLEPDYSAALQGKSTVNEIRYGDKIYQTHSIPVVAEDGSIPMGIIVFQDITELKSAEEEVKVLNSELEARIKLRTAELESLNAELEAFAYSVSHDLRAPLRSIEGFSKALAEKNEIKPDKTAEEYLGRVIAAAERMNHLIDALLSLSRLARKEMDKKEVNLSKIAYSIVKELKNSSPERKTVFKIQPDLIVNADETLIQTAIYNLLDNAFKFTSKKEEAIIEFGRNKVEGKMVFFIKDNGEGFDSQYAHKLFTPFQRLHSYDEFPGTGIGLANVQRVIKKHRGEIHVESEKGKGTVFYFTIPD